ncbi:uncharacterized protein SPPG_01416 [Spizellomyces punctatus DAOM BR117]|uniref:C2 domain-containing protein n=1 Tax=Spizellomyces punctatus (strain DAOM BR117) TaxID=645134 RepID=A0A0L0HST3_SPIPD|nr:uncharacterized protein SPPG_01416 [Spizellomyces punctatus DAOM BR117]KND03965.1 hypothetical protein SPPG_01416 [Spizellomyces punctatus DAOM BR117]|eukprot:XP_016612004.1 hypothetical protein SPPG_01416 [Spizellomyces punctatus DAOM BR117]
MPLIVRVISVAGVKDEDDLGKNDLYVRLSTDGSHWVQTTTKKGAGKQAVFDETFTFDVQPDPSSKLYVEVYDKDPLKDDKLGEAKYELSNAFSGQEVDGVVELHHHLHRHRGVVNLRISYR